MTMLGCYPPGGDDRTDASAWMSETKSGLGESQLDGVSAPLPPRPRRVIMSVSRRTGHRLLSVANRCLPSIKT
jgi:hypothetical protein